MASAFFQSERVCPTHALFAGDFLRIFWRNAKKWRFDECNAVIFEHWHLLLRISKAHRRTLPTVWTAIRKLVWACTILCTTLELFGSLQKKFITSAWGWLLSIPTPYPTFVIMTWNNILSYMRWFGGRSRLELVFQYANVRYRAPTSIYTNAAGGQTSAA